MVALLWTNNGQVYSHWLNCTGLISSRLVFSVETPKIHGSRFGSPQTLKGLQASRLALQERFMGMMLTGVVRLCRTHLECGWKHVPEFFAPNAMRNISEDQRYGFSKASSFNIYACVSTQEVVKFPIFLCQSGKIESRLKATKHV